MQEKQHTGTIDVWWLYDDGGMTLLLPYILTTRSKFSKCKLRVFFLTEKVCELDAETRNMAALLSKFRIEFKEVNVVRDVTERAARSTRDEFRALLTVRHPKGAGKASKDAERTLVTEAEMDAHAERTNFHLRIAEICRANSTSADLVVMTLPLPRRDSIPYMMYMAWLDVITRNMPPFLLVRGNQESVLTYYS